jgi:hypothetical protein
VACLLPMALGSVQMSRLARQAKVTKVEYLGAADTTVVAEKKADAMAKRVALENMVKKGC